MMTFCIVSAVAYWLTMGLGAWWLLNWARHT